MLYFDIRARGTHVGGQKCKLSRTWDRRTWGCTCASLDAVQTDIQSQKRRTSGLECTLRNETERSGTRCISTKPWQQGSAAAGRHDLLRCIGTRRPRHVRSGGAWFPRDRKHRRHRRPVQVPPALGSLLSAVNAGGVAGADVLVHGGALGGAYARMRRGAGARATTDAGRGGAGEYVFLV